MYMQNDQMLMQQAPVYMPQYMPPDPLCVQADETYCRLQMLYGEIDQTKQYLNMLQTQAVQMNRQLNQLQTAVNSRTKMQNRRKGLTSGDKVLITVGILMYAFHLLRFVIPMLLF